MSSNLIIFIGVLCLVFKCVVSISNKNDLNEKYLNTIWELSNLAVQGRQAGHFDRPYDQNYNKYPSYYQYYKPQSHRYGYPQHYISNEISNYPYNYPPYPYYPQKPYDSTPSFFKPHFFQKAQQSVMDALFSISQNDDLQCVPKLLCDVTSGTLIGRQAGLNLPVNINLESLLTLLSGFNSANSSPVLHFGKAALLGYASKGNSRSCQYAYPECPADPDRLIKYLNNHNGGFFRFFQGVNPGQSYEHNYAQQFNGYRPGYFGKAALAEKRIQNQPLRYTFNDFNSDAYDRVPKTAISFPDFPSPERYNAYRKIIFPVEHENTNSFTKRLRFPDFQDLPYRKGKGIQFRPYSESYEDNHLDIQRPLPNHVPNPNIFPDRTGTGELKLDLNDLEQNYFQSVGFDDTTKLYNNVKYYRDPNISFPNK